MTVKAAAVVLSSSSVHSSLSPSVSYLTVGFPWPFPSLPFNSTLCMFWQTWQSVSWRAQRCSHFIILFPKCITDTGLGHWLICAIRILIQWVRRHRVTSLSLFSHFVCLCRWTHPLESDRQHHDRWGHIHGLQRWALSVRYTLQLFEHRRNQCRSVSYMSISCFLSENIMQQKTKQ